VKEEGKMYFVAVGEIDWIEAFGNYAPLHTGPRTHLIRETMATLERALDARRFARIHRSTIVNLDRIRQMDLWGSGDYMVRLADGTDELRLYAGHATWVPGQLQAEIGAGGWQVLLATPDLVFDEDPSDLWQKLEGRGSNGNDVVARVADYPLFQQLAAGSSRDRRSDR